jgi:CRISPR-associated protein Csm2
MPPNPPQGPRKPNPAKPATSQSQNANATTQDITAKIIQEIDQLSEGFGQYRIRTLVEHTKDFGEHLKNQGLKTNQIRKFLDAVNQIKADLREDKTFSSKIEDEIVLLKPKLAYAAARQPSVQTLSEVMSAAIDKVHSMDDFYRLVQFLESTIAYHKASGGKD